MKKHVLIIIISSSSHHHLIIISSSSHHHLIIISSSSHHPKCEIMLNRASLVKNAATERTYQFLQGSQALSALQPV
jgi:hypothetical protein